MVYETYKHLDAADHSLEDDLNAGGWDVADPVQFEEIRDGW